MTPLTDSRTTPQPSAQQREPPSEGKQSIMFLEPEQLASDRSIAVPPAQLSGHARVALWLLRIFALTVTFMVIYTFVTQLP
jgi:hypothetical protein